MKQKSIIHLLIFLLLQITTLQVNANEIYRCTKNGKTIFTDQPCDGKRIRLSPVNALPSVDAQPREQYEKPQYNSGKWYIDAAGYKKALKISEKYRAPLFIYYQADWCGYCRKLEKGLLNKSAAKKILRHVVKVRISPEHGSGEDALFKSMGGTGYPTVLTQTNASANPVRQLIGKLSM